MAKPAAPTPDPVAPTINGELALLIEQFDLAIRTPEDVAQLKQLILQLAVMGKLVPQDPDDEPAAVLLERIAHQRLIEGHREVSINGKSNNAALTDHTLPMGWHWTRFGELFFDMQGGSQPPKSQFIDTPQDGYVRLLQIRDFGPNPVPTYVPADSVTKFCDEEDVLIGRYGASVGKILTGMAGAYNVALVRVIFDKANLNRRFVTYLLESHYFQSAIQQSSRSAQSGFNKRDVFPLRFPLPPTAEQHRIVAKVDELMAAADELSGRLAAAGRQRERFHTAALHQLTTAETPTKTAAAWSLLDGRFDALYDDPAAVAELKQAILQLAVMGRLVPQDPDDEPAAVLLERIGEEKNLKRRKYKSSELDAELSRILPCNWELARFSEVANIASNLTDPASYGSLPHVAPNNIESGTGRLLDYRTVQEDGVHSSKHRFYAGQILYSKIRPNLSKVVIVDFEGLCSADMYPLDSFIDIRFLHVYMLSQPFVSRATQNDTRVAMPKINQSKLREILVLVPPLAEQRRIVAKVDELFALADEVAARAGAAEVARGRLLAALVGRGVG